MEWITLIQNAIDYIEDHILEDINYEDIKLKLHLLYYHKLT